MDFIETINSRDAAAEYALETMDYGGGVLSSQIRSRTHSQTDHTVISWEVDDPENPLNWSSVSLPPPGQDAV